MALAGKVLSKIVPSFSGSEADEESPFRYRRLWISTVLITTTVSLAPLIIMTILTYYQYQKALRAEIIQPIYRLTSIAKRSLESFLRERTSALSLIIAEKTFEDLADQQKLSATLRNLKRSFGGFVDLGLVDLTGLQRSYVGPYPLSGVNYSDQDWFHEVKLREIYVSDVFMGYRNFPHFVIAVKHETNNGNFYVLRATIDTEVLNEQTLSLVIRSSNDAFIINRQGMLQTPSRAYGEAMKPCPLAVPPYSERGEVVEVEDKEDNPFVLGYAYIDQSPFIFMLVKQPDVLMHNWYNLRNKLLGFLAISVLANLLLIMGTSNYLVSHIREADSRRARMMHNAEYTNKLATVGRLASGVAHEINNPLAIINEKAGLMKDLVSLSEAFHQKEKFAALIDSIIASVDRCSTITHRLLGFAKHMDVDVETINLHLLIKEVLGFLEKEASFRNITVNLHVPSEFPSIQSDRGQLQQVFLNIINNAFAAVEDQGHIDIDLREDEGNRVSVSITDDGPGIEERHLNRIFEPFFTTKKGYGTGLGLSITYGIVSKLGGQISVESLVGQGTSFTVTLPIHR